MSLLADTPAPATPATPATPAAPATSRPLPDGIYVPMLTFFDPETEDVDVGAMQQQAVRLQQAGVAGLLLHGSNGEAVHLTRAERVRNIQAVVDAVRAGRAGRADRRDLGAAAAPFPVLAGCGAQSVRETVELCAEAAAAGATHALVLPPGYYAGLLGPAQVRAFFVAVAAASPVPVLVYNFPPAAHGVDLDSDALCALAAAHPNLAGVKLTCGNTGKLARVVAGAGAAGRGPGSANPFFVAGGSADFILQGAVVGAHASIAGLANLAPRACAAVLALLRQGRLGDARRLQAVVAQADALAIRHGFVGVKHGLQAFGRLDTDPATAAAAHRLPSAVPRRPCRPLAAAAQAEFDAGTAALLEAERALAAQAQR